MSYEAQHTWCKSIGSACKRNYHGVEGHNSIRRRVGPCRRWRDDLDSMLQKMWEEHYPGTWYNNETKLNI